MSSTASGPSIAANTSPVCTNCGMARCAYVRRRSTSRAGPESDREANRRRSMECAERGAIVLGAFDDERIAAFGVLENQLRGPHRDQLQMVYLYCDRAYRGRGLGVQLLNRLADHARALGARALYTSATPTQYTVAFYLNRGCRLADPPDTALLDHEPDDIHLVYDLWLLQRRDCPYGLLAENHKWASSASSRLGCPMSTPTLFRPRDARIRPQTRIPASSGYDWTHSQSATFVR